MEVELDEALARLPHDVDGRPRLGLEEALHLGPVVRCHRSRGRSGGQARRGGQGRGLGPPPPARPEREAAAQERHGVASREGPRGGPALLRTGVWRSIGAPRARERRREGTRAGARARDADALGWGVGTRGDPVMGRQTGAGRQGGGARGEAEPDRNRPVARTRPVAFRDAS